MTFSTAVLGALDAAGVAEITVGALIGAVVGVLAKDYIPGVRRWLVRKPIVDVHVERDLSVIWAGSPPWVGSGFVFGGDVPDSAPSDCRDWWEWAHERGGLDADLTRLRLTFSTTSEAVVVLSAFRTKVKGRSAPEPAWQVLRCATGGASMTVRHVRIDLDLFDTPTTQFVSELGEAIAAPVLSLKKDEAETFDVQAYASSMVVDWTLELLVIVNGKRKTIEISDDGMPFTTCGTSGLPESMRTGGGPPG